MLVYGDALHTEDPQEKLDCIAASLVRVSSMSAGLDRHAALVAALTDPPAPGT